VTDTHTARERERERERNGHTHDDGIYAALSIASRGKNRHIACVPQSRPIITLQATSVG